MSGTVFTAILIIPPEKRKGNIAASQEFWADQQEAAEIVRMDETEAKYAAMFEQRAKKGVFHRPYFGCREFACSFRLVNPGEDLVQPIDETRDLGFMLYDMNFEDPDNPTPQFFRAYMEKGVVNTDRREVEVRG